MKNIPWLIIGLCERLENGFVSLGQFDMTLPAAHAVRDGDFPQWCTGFIPPGPMVNVHLSHPARMAAWAGRLYSYDLLHLSESFPARVGRFGGPERLIGYLEAKYAARGVRLHAETLLAQVGEADFVPTREVAALAHPVTGELIRVSDGFVPGEAPFAFAGREVQWPGVDARDLVEYTKECGSEPDAAGYLATSFPGPVDLLYDVEGLDVAIHALRYYRDAARFRKWVGEWNRRNSFSVLQSDGTRAVSVSEGRGREFAMAWCRDYLASAISLENSVDELYSNP